MLARALAPRNRAASPDRVTEPIPAATLVLFRDGPSGPEHLFVERAATMVFAGGAVVFPGGRVDPGDYAAAARFPSFDLDEAAARIAAIRETIEEAGIAVGILGAADVEVLRTALHGGAEIGALLDAHDLTLDLDALVPFARWRPNFKETRTFDTRFYLARVEADHAEARVDTTENVHLFWATAIRVLTLADAKKVKVIFPTRRNLERLAKLDGFDAVAAHVAQHPVETITPWVEERNDVPHLCIPAGLGYPVTSEELSSAMRG
ncbi:MAG: NUDIX hydrolase [Sphingomonadales bacterium]